MAIHDQLKPHFQTISVLEAEKGEIRSFLLKKDAEIEGLRRTHEQLADCYTLVNQELRSASSDSSNEISSRKTECVEKRRAKKAQIDQG